MSLDHFDALLATNQLIMDLKRSGELRDAWTADQEAVLSRYPLTGSELAAIRTRNFKALYDLGVHQFLLAQFARLVYGTADGSNSGRAVEILMEQYGARPSS